MNQFAKLSTSFFNHWWYFSVMNNSRGLFEQLPAALKGRSGWPWTEHSPLVPESMPDGSMWPRISIVTPSLNQGQFIEETIRSVLLQNYPNLEYIIIDGGSNDDSVNIIEKYDPWISYWVSEPDRGQSHAINKGLRRSTGDILCWLNSDDWLMPGALRLAAQKIEIQTAAWLIGCAEVTTSKGGKKYTKQLKEEVSLKTFRNWNLDWIPQQSTFWNRRIMERCGYLDETLHYAMDVDFLFRLFEITVPLICHDVLANYRIQPGAKTQIQSDKSIRETADWITKNILLNQDKPEKIIAEYVTDTIVLQKKMNQIRRHPVIGKCISFWGRFVNSNFNI